MSIFGQVWVFSAIAFVLGAFLAWVFLVRPARKQVRDLEARLAAREADLRRISEPALGASDAMSGRASRNDPFRDADEALAAGGASALTGTYGGPDTGDRNEPETDWPERDSLAGLGESRGAYDSYGSHGEERDDFDLADRPEDLEVPGERSMFDDRGYDDRAEDKQGYGAHAYDDRDDRDALDVDERGVFDDREDRPYGDRADGRSDDTDREADEDIDAALDAADRDCGDQGYGDQGYGDGDYGDQGRGAGDYYDDAGYDAGGAEETRYVPAIGDAEPIEPVSSVLDPDEMRSRPPQPEGTETTQLIGPDAQPGHDDRSAADSGAESDAESAGQAGRPAASALDMGTPFTPVTSFEATTELPVGGADAIGAGGPSATSPAPQTS
ncbi:hypothetical protein ACZ91_24910, partial [Streptomyces regensis]